MTSLAIWLDQEQAKFFRFNNEKVETSHLKSKHQDHHHHHPDHLDQQRQEHAFFAEAAGKITDASRVLILGPGGAKDHFHKYLVEHHAEMAKRVAGCETVDHPSDPQIAAHARKFFDLKDEH